MTDLLARNQELHCRIATLVDLLDKAGIAHEDTHERFTTEKYVLGLNAEAANMLRALGSLDYEEFPQKTLRRMVFGAIVNKHPISCVPSPTKSATTHKLQYLVPIEAIGKRALVSVNLTDLVSDLDDDKSVAFVTAIEADD